MNDFCLQSFDQRQHSDIACDENFENDDLIAFQHESKTINLYFSQLTKYSKHIRESYLYSDVINRFPQEIHQFQEEFQLLPENIGLFFQLTQQNYNINENLILTYIQCIDLLKISKYLEIRKLSSKINQYILSQKINVDFVIQMIEYDIKTQVEKDDHQIKLSNEIESLLSSQINECFSNEKFKELPIEIIYRVIKQSSPKLINSNKLYDIIIKSLNKFCVLFQFIELQKLSEDRLEELCEIFSKSNENTKHYFDYLKCNLNLIKNINNQKKNLEEMNDEHINKMKDLEVKFTSLQNQFNYSEKMNDQLQNQLNEQQSKVKDLEILLQKQSDNSEDINSQLQHQINYSKDLEIQISQLQNKLTSSEKYISDINKQINKLLIIKGKIVASVEKEFFINAEIKLKTKGPSLDTSKSKIIISTSDEEYLGSKAYEKGEPITSLHMKTTFVCNPGKYYVRCIVFNSNGESNEIVSNAVTTRKNCITFEYEGKPTKISLPQGQYKLEVWGAKGGDGTGKGYNNRQSKTVQGGLGGYSRGILSLDKKEDIYVFVGEEGHTSNSSEGSSTEGGFPDGGGTKTGHYSNYTTVPGTGGGSTSIRIGSDTNNSRVIVAGGGGGAGGSGGFADTGGFGGGLNGGNCYFQQELQSQGAGSQTGSTSGRGIGGDGVPGVFGSGATSKFKQGSDSGGGGGGGWYGGGSGGGGIGKYCSSGGGGSGWTFTESNLKTFQSGDPSNASKFVLDSSYYLNDAISIGGDKEFPRPDGNGNEKGHTGHGYAKITLL